MTKAKLLYSYKDTAAPISRRAGRFITRTTLMKFYAKITDVYCDNYTEYNGLHFVDRHKVRE
jgi:hypothetical protein